MPLTQEQEKTAQRLRFAAHQYVDIGWNVFPLQPKSKEPHFKALAKTGHLNNGHGSWKPLQTEQVTHAMVNEWYDLDPFCNIALICGKVSGVVVIDIDTPKPDMPPEIKANYNDPVDVAKEVGTGFTLTALTGRKGKHIFCKYEDGIGCPKIPPQIDIKGEGGYVVLPPSIHPNGQPYVFENTDMFPLTLKNMDNLADFPSFLMPIVLKADQKKTGDDWLKIIDGVHEGEAGGRNNAAASLVGKLLTAVHKEFERSDFEDGRFVPIMWEFLMWWNQKNTPPMPESELATVFKSIVKRG